jgi:hypothetical protein
MSENENLDRPLWGAEEIGREAGLIDKNGKVKLRAAFYQLEKGNIDASKVGDQWVSTRRRIRNSLSAGETA